MQKFIYLEANFDFTLSYMQSQLRFLISQKQVQQTSKMYLNTPTTPTMLFRPTSKSPRPGSHTDSNNDKDKEIVSQLKSHNFRRPPSFLIQKIQEDVVPLVVITAPQSAKLKKDLKRDESKNKLKLPQRIYQNKSANKYQQDKSHENSFNNSSFKNDNFLNVKTILPPKPRKLSESLSNVDVLLEKVHHQGELIKEIKKIAENKVSDNIRKNSKEKHRKERSIQKKTSKAIIQSPNKFQLKSDPPINLSQLIRKQSNTHRNPQQFKTIGRQKLNANWNSKQIDFESPNTTEYKSKATIQRPRSYLDLLSNSKHEINSIQTSNYLNFEENSRNLLALRKNSTQISKFRFEEDKLTKINKSFFNQIQFKDIGLRQTIIERKKASIKDFDLKKKLGEGKFGIVYQAFHIQTKTLYAIKKISKQVIRSNLMIDQLLQEIKIQFYCNHENILKIYGFFDDLESIYLILEYMQEGTLFQLFKKQKTLSQKQAATILKQIASGIIYLQQNGIAHRDIKPQNIVMSNGEGKLCDFGWAAICNDRRKTYCGTFDYVAPEILQGNEYDETVDLWCLGVMAYELMIGKAPFYHISRKQTTKKIMNANLEFPSHLSKNAISFVQGLIRRNPQQRMNGQDILKHPFIALGNQEKKN